MLLSFWSQRSKPRWYTAMTVICFDLSKASKAISEEAQCHTYAVSHPVDPVPQHSGGKHSDGVIHSEAKILSWSMEPSAVKFTVATSATAIYNVTSLSCANWHFSVHESPKINLQAAPFTQVYLVAFRMTWTFSLERAYGILLQLSVLSKLPDFQKMKF